MNITWTSTQLKGSKHFKRIASSWFEKNRRRRRRRRRRCCSCCSCCSCCCREQNEGWKGQFSCHDGKRPKHCLFIKAAQRTSHGFKGLGSGSALIEIRYIGVVYIWRYGLGRGLRILWGQYWQFQTHNLATGSLLLILTTWSSSC